MEKINVLSLFDGCSGAQQALQRSNIEVDKYFACEIDKYAIQVTQANYPNTIQLGSVTELDNSTLPPIYLIVGGSPCQSFSFAGKRKGMATKCETEILTLDHYLELKSEGFEFEGQSYLFWEYMRILKEVKPKYFLLENVEMGQKWESVLSKAIGVNGIHINSALVSAQNRRRIYWTNIGLEPGGLFGDLVSTIQQPKDRKILLKDILESYVDDKYFLSEKMLNYFNTRKANYNNGKINYKTENDIASCINASSGAVDISDNIIIDTNRKSRCFTAGGNSGGLHSQMDLIVAQRGRGEDNEQQLEPRFDGKTNCITSVAKDNYVKSKKTIRRLTPTECERLQTVKDGYTAHVSDSQRYKMLGNGFTIEVISHILNYMK